MRALQNYPDLNLVAVPVEIRTMPPDGPNNADHEVWLNSEPQLKTYMKRSIAFMMGVLVYGYSVSAQTKIPIEEAGKHIGETVTICSRVYGARYLESSATKPTLLNLGGSYPKNLLTVLINDADRKNFPR